MPARIRILQGISQGTIFPIQKNFTRVGSDDSSDLCLPASEIPGSVCIVEFNTETKEYQVFCRCNHTVHYNGRQMQEGKKFIWKPGRSLSIGDKTILELETAADPTPIPVESKQGIPSLNAPATTDDFRSAEKNATRSKKETANTKSGVDASTAIKVAVILLCVLAIPLMYVAKTLMPEKTSAPVLSYDKLEGLITEEANSGQIPDVLKRRFREAHRLENIAKDRALKEYNEIRTLLLKDQAENHQEFSGSEEIVELKENIWNFVIHRIKVLKEKPKE